MSFLKAIVFGAIWGFTEPLPISGEGHAALFQYFSGIHWDIPSLLWVFRLGVLVAVIITFWDFISDLFFGFFTMIRDIFERRFNVYNLPYGQKITTMLILSMLPLGLTFYLRDTLRATTGDNDIIIEGICFFITGAILYFAVNGLPGRRRGREMRGGEALILGFAQAIFPISGISRTALTLSATMLFDFEKNFALAFSFVMGIPATIGILFLDGRAVFGAESNTALPVLIVGFLVALIFGIFAVGIVKWLVSRDRLHFFSYYNLLLGLLTFMIGIFERLQGAPIQEFITAFFK